MIFKHINHEEVEKHRTKITINNFDISSYHWGSLKNIKQYLEEVDLISYDLKSFDNKIIELALKILNDNERLEDISFYRHNEKLILLCKSNVRRFQEQEELGSKEALISTANGIIFSIIELTDQDQREMQKGEKSLPDSWKKDTVLNKQLEKLKLIFTDL